MAKRFFVNMNEISINGENISVTGPEIHHINVLRHKVGDTIKINEFVVRIDNISQTEIVGKILVREEDNNKRTFVTLYQSYIKSDKMEFVVQKSVELGVDKIVPFISKNSVVKLDEKDKIKKIERLNKISMEASKQCDRNDIVKVENVIEIKNKESFISKLNENNINILAYEKSSNSLKEVLNNIEENYINNKLAIGIIIGPEGGFDEQDLEVIKKASNVHEVSLGKRILRAETASLNLLSILNYELEK